MKKERRKEVLDGRYTVTESGRVYSNFFRNKHAFFRRKTPLELKPAISQNGYYKMHIRPLGGNVSLHRLVATAFHGPCPKGYECAHLDGNPSNNHASNLKWVSRKENHSHCVQHGTRLFGEKANGSVLKENQAKEVHYLLSEGLSCAEIARRYGVDRSTVSLIKRGKTWKAQEARERDE